MQFFNLRTQLGKELYEANPKSENLKNGLAISYSKLGGIFLILNNETEAKKNFENCKNFFEQSVKENPQNVNNRSNYAEISAISAIFNLHQNPANTQAAHNLEKAIGVWQNLFENTNMPSFKKKIEMVNQFKNGAIDYKTTIINLTKE